MRIIAACVSVAAVALLSTVSAQVPSIAPARPLTPDTGATVPAEIPGTSTHALTKEDVEAWLDGFFPYALQRGDIAGAVVTVVKDGQTLLSKGYGYADVAARKPVDPERTTQTTAQPWRVTLWSASREPLSTITSSAKSSPLSG